MDKRTPVIWLPALGVWLYGSVAVACDSCRPQVQAGIFNARFVGRLALTLMPLAVVLLLIALIVWTPWRRMPKRGRAWSR